MKTFMVLCCTLLVGALIVRLEFNLYRLQADSRLLQQEAIYRTLENPVYTLAGDSTPTPTPRKPATMHVTQRLNGPFDPQHVLNQLGTQQYRVVANPTPTPTARPGSPQAHHRNLPPIKEAEIFARYEAALAANAE